MEQFWGLAGVAIGWGLTSVTELVRRRWTRQEKMHDLYVQRGEELLQCCQQTLQWMEDAGRAAFQGDVYVPIQHPIFRLAAVVQIYFHSLEADAQALDSAARTYRGNLLEIAGNKRRGLPMTEQLNTTLQGGTHALHAAIGGMLHKTRDAVRTKVHEST